MRKNRFRQMRKLSFIAVLFFQSISLFSTEYKSIALRYFNDSIAVNKEYSGKHFILGNENLPLKTSNCCDFCLNFKDNFEPLSTVDEPLKIPQNGRVLKRLGFLRSFFVSKKRLKKIFVYEPVLVESQIVVVIQVSDNLQDNFISITIDSASNTVIDYCIKDFYT